MGQVTFTAAFSGGFGNLDISFDDIPDELHLDPGNTSGTVTLPPGADVYSVSGDSPTGPGGNIDLEITGDILAPIQMSFPPGLIIPQDHSVVVTI